MVTLESAENALKNVYLGVVSNQLNTNVNPLFNRIEQTTSDVWGNEIRKLAPYGINGGIGAGTEDGALPIPAENKRVQFVSTLKNLYGTIKISDKAMRASQNSAGAFVNLLNDEMEGLIKASKFNFARMLYGDGSGLLAKVTDCDLTDVVDSTKNLIEGMVVDCYNESNQSVGQRRLKYIDKNAKGIYFESGLLYPANSTLYLQGSRDNELTGLGAIFGNGTSLYGVSKTDYPWMNPYKKTITQIGDTAIQTAIDFLNETNGSDVDFITCSSDVKRFYQQYLGAYRRNIDTMELNGGYKALTYNGIPLMSDRFVSDGTMYLLNTKQFHLHQLCDWKWLEGDGNKVIKQVAGTPTYTATLVKYADLICDQPNGQAMLSGITGASTTV
jgi:hypothetical protein